jgi:hypothetical protein
MGENSKGSAEPLSLRLRFGSSLDWITTQSESSVPELESEDRGAVKTFFFFFGLAGVTLLMFFGAFVFLEAG